MKSIISFEIEFSIKQDLLNLEDHDTCLLSDQKESRLIWKKEKKKRGRALSWSTFLNRIRST